MCIYQVKFDKFISFIVQDHDSKTQRNWTLHKDNINIKCNSYTHVSVNIKWNPDKFVCFIQQDHQYKKMPLEYIFTNQKH